MTFLSRCLAIGSAALTAGLLVVSPARCQQELQAVSSSGKVVSVEQGVVNMTTAANEPYSIQVPPQGAKVVVTGMAKLEFLRAGLFVTFRAELDKRGKGLAEIKELGVFTPSEKIQPGISNDEPESKTGPFTVAGQIRSAKKGRLTVAAPGKQVQIQVAEDAKIELAVDDYSLAQPGDDVSFFGQLLRPGQGSGEKAQPTLALAEEMDIKLAEPAAAPSKKKPSRAKPVPPKEKKASP